MCGIFAIFGSPHVTYELQLIAIQQAEKIRHRGPDWGGAEYHTLSNGLSNILCHERLAMVDKVRGTQPLYNGDRTISCCVNGEIWNYKSLITRHIGQAYSTATTNSDCQCIPYLFEKYGPQMLPYLDGMFAIVLANKTTGEIFAARDPLGETSLYLGVSSLGAFAFASEMKALQAICEEIVEIPPGSYLYFSLNDWTPPSSTLTTSHPIFMPLTQSSVKVVAPPLFTSKNLLSSLSSLLSSPLLSSPLSSSPFSSPLFESLLLGTLAFSRRRSFLSSSHLLSSCHLSPLSSFPSELCVLIVENALALVKSYESMRLNHLRELPPLPKEQWNLESVLLKEIDKRAPGESYHSGIFLNGEISNFVLVLLYQSYLMKNLSSFSTASPIPSPVPLSPLSSPLLTPPSPSLPLLPLHTYSIGMKGDPHLEQCRKFAHDAGTIHHEFHFNQDEALSALPSLIYTLETTNENIVRYGLLHFLLSRRLRGENCRCLLTMEGLDSLLSQARNLSPLESRGETGEERRGEERRANIILEGLREQARTTNVIYNKCYMAFGVEARSITSGLVESLVQIGDALPWLHKDSLNEILEKYSSNLASANPLSANSLAANPETRSNLTLQIETATRPISLSTQKKEKREWSTAGITMYDSQWVKNVFSQVCEKFTTYQEELLPLNSSMGLGSAVMPRATASTAATQCCMPPLVSSSPMAPLSPSSPHSPHSPQSPSAVLYAKQQESMASTRHSHHVLTPRISGGEEIEGSMKDEMMEKTYLLSQHHQTLLSKIKTFFPASQHDSSSLEAKLPLSREVLQNQIFVYSWFLTRFSAH